MRIPRWSLSAVPSARWTPERALAYAEIVNSPPPTPSSPRCMSTLVELYVPDVRISLDALAAIAYQLMTDALRTVGVTLNIGTHHIVLADDGERPPAKCKAEIQDGVPTASGDQPCHLVPRRPANVTGAGFGAEPEHFLVYGAGSSVNLLDQPDADWPARQTSRGTVCRPASRQAFFAD